MGIKLNELKENKVVLVLTSATKYASTNLEILGHYLKKQNYYGVYITINKPYNTLIKMLKDKKIPTERLFIIDGITPISSGVKRIENCVFLGNPRALTEMSISATSAIKSLPKGKRFLFLDSLSTLVVYNEAGSVTKFSHFLINKIKEWEISGVIISLEKETDQKMIAQLTQFVDEVMTVN